MKVLEFNIKKGIFHLEINNLSVNKHSHPAMEIMIAKRGAFSLETDSGKRNNLNFVIIDSNINHKILTKQNEIELLMIESNNTKLKDYLFRRGIELKDGVFTSSELKNPREILHDLLDLSADQDLKQTNDKRIYDCIEIMESKNLPYNKMITTLTEKIFLSESRLSHLFTENVGISIKKYHVWNKLKFALHFFLSEGANLKEASLEANFFDQPHLSKAFRSYLGINPSEVFNSRTLQL